VLEGGVEDGLAAGAREALLVPDPACPVQLSVVLLGPSGCRPPCVTHPLLVPDPAPTTAISDNFKRRRRRTVWQRATQFTA